MTWPALVAAAVLMFAPEALAQNGTALRVAVLEPWTRTIAVSAPAAVGYLTLRNDSAEPDRLMSASSPFARAIELHGTSIEGDTVRMRSMEGGLTLLPGSTTRLEPGGLHLMLIGPAQALKLGERLPLLLQFEHDGDVGVELRVEAADARRANPRARAHNRNSGTFRPCPVGTLERQHLG